MLNKVFNSSLAAKFALPICGFTIIALCIGGYVLLNVAKRSTGNQVTIAQEALKAEQNAAQERAYQRLLSKADIIGEFLAKTAPPLLETFDFKTVREYQKLAAADQDIRYSAYLNPTGNPEPPLQ